jgi:small conductance mechanosensitive channel
MKFPLLNLLLQNDNLDMTPIAEELEKNQKAISAFQNLSFDDAITKVVNSVVDFSFKLLVAILVLYVGKFVIRKLYKMAYKLMVHRNVDASLTTFVLSLIRMVLYFILIITIVGILGIETSSFLALFASAGVAVGMALSGTLQNFAGGVLILLLKPYKVGDYIEAQGYTGTVKAIQIFHTVINTVDNKAIIIPNGGLSTGSINNYSLENYRRVDWKIGLSYGTDYNKVKETILAMLSEDNRVVEKYVEDDMIKRAMIEHGFSNDEDNMSDNTSNTEDAAIEQKNNWWKRMRQRRRDRRDEIQKRLHEKINMPAGLVVKIDRTPFVGLDELADSSINLVVRAWTHSSNYWDLYYDMNQRFYTELPEKGFSFPFPQLDVHFDESIAGVAKQ